MRIMGKILNISALKAAGIDFSEDVASPSEIFEECPQAKQLVDYLLNFNNIITLETWVSSFLGSESLRPMQTNSHMPIEGVGTARRQVHGINSPRKAKYCDTKGTA